MQAEIALDALAPQPRRQLAAQEMGEARSARPDCGKQADAPPETRDRLATSCGSRPGRGDVRVAGAEHVLHHGAVGASLGADARRGIPDIGDVGARLDEQDVDAERLDLKATTSAQPSIAHLEAQ